MSTAPTLDEGALRRPGFTEGVAITLSDGQAWTLPLPVLDDFYPRPGEDGLLLDSGSQFGPQYDDLVEAYLAADTGREEVLTLVNLVFFLLRKNYRIEAGDLRHLLRVKRIGAPGAEDNASMWRALSEVALGQTPAPKPTPVG